jgi:hypothetical protein
MSVLLGLLSTAVRAVARGRPSWSLRKRTTSLRHSATYTSMPVASDASAALATGTTARHMPRSRAPRSWLSTPRTGRSAPESDSSPSSRVPTSALESTVSQAACTATAMARS